MNLLFFATHVNISFQKWGMERILFGKPFGLKVKITQTTLTNFVAFRLSHTHSLGGSFSYIYICAECLLGLLWRRHKVCVFVSLPRTLLWHDLTESNPFDQSLEPQDLLGFFVVHLGSSVLIPFWLKGVSHEVYCMTELVRCNAKFEIKSWKNIISKTDL